VLRVDAQIAVQFAATTDTLTSPGATAPTDTAERPEQPDQRTMFWARFWARHHAERPPASPGDAAIADLASFAAAQEKQIRQDFPRKLEERLRPALGQVTVLVRRIDYGSLLVGFSVLSSVAASLGITLDDVWSLIDQFAQDALADSLTLGLTGATVTTTQAAPEKPRSRLLTIQALANGSLFLVSALIATAAGLLFNATHDKQMKTLEATTKQQSDFFEVTAKERAALTQALIEERKALQSERAELRQGLVAAMELPRAAAKDQTEVFKTLAAAGLFRALLDAKPPPPAVRVARVPVKRAVRRH